MSAKKLYLVRHGQSIWNKKNRFTGWVDIPLSIEGVEEAVQAGKKLADMPIDVIYCSDLMRAKMTIPFIMMHHKSGKIPLYLHPGEGKMEEWGKIYDEEAKKETIPVTCASQLNERMYGKLQGLNKADTAKKFGADQVQIWRRSFDTQPPDGESLAMTAARTLPYFKAKIIPELEKNNVLISAHGNSLRSIVMHIKGLTKEEVVKLELGTGTPVIFSYEAGKWHDLS